MFISEEQNNQFARMALAKLVRQVLDYQGGQRWITYADLARSIGYPEPYIGDDFGRRIGRTLLALGHLFDGIVIDGMPVPRIQALAVAKKTRLPGVGFKAFYPVYAQLPEERQRDFVESEYARIFNFGSRWLNLLNRLGIPAEGATKGGSGNGSLYNPYGSEGSPEHIALRDRVAANPARFGLPPGTKGLTEYPLKSGDRIDVVFEFVGRVLLAVEVKSLRSSPEDLERGLYQCVKYAAVLAAQEVGIGPDSIPCVLVVEGRLPAKHRREATRLNIRVHEDG